MVGSQIKSLLIIRISKAKIMAQNIGENTRFPKRKTKDPFVSLALEK